MGAETELITVINGGAFLRPFRSSAAFSAEPLAAVVNAINQRDAARAVITPCISPKRLPTDHRLHLLPFYSIPVASGRRMSMRWLWRRRWLSFSTFYSVCSWAFLALLLRIVTIGFFSEEGALQHEEGTVPGCCVYCCGSAGCCSALVFFLFTSSSSVQVRF